MDRLGHPLSDLLAFLSELHGEASIAVRINKLLDTSTARGRALWDPNAGQALSTPQPAPEYEFDQRVAW